MMIKLVDNVVYITQPGVRVYSDRTRQRQNYGVKRIALDLEHMSVIRSIQTGRVASKNLYNRDAIDLSWRGRSE